MLISVRSYGTKPVRGIKPVNGMGLHVARELFAVIDVSLCALSATTNNEHSFEIDSYSVVAGGSFIPTFRALKSSSNVVLMGSVLFKKYQRTQYLFSSS